MREHLSLVHYAVAEVTGRVPRHVSRDDLVSAGMAGLAQAARNFDEARGIRFDRYASNRIKGALLDELRSCDWASRSVRARARRLNEATERLTGDMGRTPTPDELATHLGCDVSDLQASVDDVHRAVVLNYDSLVDQGTADEVIPADSRTPDSIVLERERQAYLVDAVASLPERLRQVVLGYFFDERAMQDLADELGVTESRISQMRSEALALLREGMNSQLDPDAVVPETGGNGRVARRKAAYFDAVSHRSTFHHRLSATPSLASLAS